MTTQSTSTTREPGGPVVGARRADRANGPRADSPTSTALRRVLRVLAADNHLLLAVAIVVPVLVSQLLVHEAWEPSVVAPTAAYLALQLLLGRRGAARNLPAIDFLRLALALVYVAVVGELRPDTGTPPLLVLYIPIVAMAATVGGREAVAIGAAAIAAYAVPVLFDPTPDVFVRDRAVALAATGALLAIGTRRTVTSLERTTRRLRSVIHEDRARARRLDGIEEVGRLLARAGPTSDALAGVVDLLQVRFGYPLVSIYLGDEHLMRLGAQRGYQVAIPEFEPSGGVLGEVMSTREGVVVPDVAADPRYIPVPEEVVSSLVCVPLVAAGELIGALNVEARPPNRLDERDLATLRLVADRLASALALARDRERLAHRAARFEALTAFSQRLTSTLEPGELNEVVTEAVAAVVPADTITLTLRDPLTGSFRLVAASGGNAVPVAAPVEPGARGERPPVAAPDPDDARATDRAGRSRPSLAVPLVRNGIAVGAIALTRLDPEHEFDELDREVLPLMAAQTALALANAELHRAATEASIRDPLTGLHNRRHLDATLDRMSARRGRERAETRSRVAAILFDLDHFGRFNKRYGHAVGDEVLRRFAALLKARFRAADLVARYGGEEFVAVLDDAARDDAVRIAEEIRLALAATVIDGPNGEPLRATVSAGCSELGPDEPSLEHLLTTADVALAMAKAAGRDRVVAA